MRNKLALFSGVLFSLAMSVTAAAQQVQATPVRRILNSSPIQPFAYAQLIASTTKGVKGIQVNNTGSQVLELAFGASGSEVNQVIIGSNQDTAVLPVSAGYATRISAIALSGPSEVGELELNVFYN